MNVVLEVFDGRVLDYPVHAHDLAVGPRMVGLGQAKLDPVGLADHAEAHLSRIGGVSVPGPLGELDANVRQDRMDRRALLVSGLGRSSMTRCGSGVPALAERKTRRSANAAPSLVAFAGSLATHVARNARPACGPRASPHYAEGQ